RSWCGTSPGGSAPPRAPTCSTSIIGSHPSIRSRRRSRTRSPPIAGSPAGSIPGGSPSWAIPRAAGPRPPRPSNLALEGLALPAATVAVSPWTDLALTGPSLQVNAAADPMLDVANLPALARGYLAGADPRNHYASPLYGDASGLPPTLIHVGSDEILRDDATRMAEKLKAAGCDVEIEVWPRMPHAWHLYARIIPEGRRALARIGTFLQQRL